jgi:hypothetical protein
MRSKKHVLRQSLSHRVSGFNLNLELHLQSHLHARLHMNRDSTSATTSQIGFLRGFSGYRDTLHIGLHLKLYSSQSLHPKHAPTLNHAVFGYLDPVYYFMV